WRIAAAILQDYRDVLDLSGADAYDPSGLITSAADLWEANPKAAAAESARIQYVVIDDFQDATPAIHRLVQLIGTNRDIVITANPDTTVQGYRGARPQALVNWPELLSPEAKTTSLTTGYRMGPRLLEAYRRTVGRVPAVAGLPDIRTNLKPSQDAAEVTV